MSNRSAARPAAPHHEFQPAQHNAGMASPHGAILYSILMSLVGVDMPSLTRTRTVSQLLCGDSLCHSIFCQAKLILLQTPVVLQLSCLDSRGGYVGERGVCLKDTFTVFQMSPNIILKSPKCAFCPHNHLNLGCKIYWAIKFPHF